MIKDRFKNVVNAITEGAYTGRKVLCDKGVGCLTCKKMLAFTLAEILISLLILGVIASLVIPSLIQNTHKKEEIVKIKKGLSMINQAISMDKALTGEDLAQYNNAQTAVEMFKKRLSITDYTCSSETQCVFLTQDGLGYLIETNSGFNSNSNNTYAYGLIITKPCSSAEDVYAVADDYGFWCDSSSNCLDGAYDILCYSDRCVPNNETVTIINAK